jgi:hypothetical protein
LGPLDLQFLRYRWALLRSLLRNYAKKFCAVASLSELSLPEFQRRKYVMDRLDRLFFWLIIWGVAVSIPLMISAMFVLLRELIL